MKIQTKVLKDIYFEGKKISPKKISQNTGLPMQQVYNAIYNLQNRRLIKIEKGEREEGGYKKAPVRRILVEINDSVLDRIKKVIRRGEDE